MSNHYPSKVSYQGVVPLEQLSHLLEREGLSVIRTFDLRSTSPGTGPHCFCVTHRLDSCDCQLVVLMVYDKGPEPATLIFQEQDGKARLSLAEVPGRALSRRIMNALLPAGIVPSIY